MTIRSVKSGTLNTLQVTGVSSIAVPTPPAKPTISNVGANGATVSFTPALIGGTATSFTATASPGGSTITDSSSPLQIAGLSDSTSYTVVVKATNANGDSVDSVASDSFTTLTPYNLNINYLVIAGGGSNSGSSLGGGGGAGGYRTSYSTTGGGGSAESPVSITSGIAYTVTVGAGGSNSVFSSVTSTAGGNAPGGSGGSGGGGGGTRTASPVQGMNGGSSGYGGGGGASQVGSNGGPGRYGSYGGSGGNGLASSITGTSVTRASGGGGTGYYANGANGSGTRSDNTGYGGQAPGQHNNGSPGGSGVVILRYATSAGTITIGAGLTGSTATLGVDKVTTITAGTGNVSFS